MTPSQPAAPLPNDLVDPLTAARIFGVSRWTIYTWLRKGYIPHYKVGRLFRVRRVDLAAWLEKERRSGFAA